MNNWVRKSNKKIALRNDGFYDAFVKNAIQQYKSNDAYYETKATDEDLTLIYQNALARKIVNAPAEDVVKNGFKIDGDENDKIYQELETLMFERKLVDAIRWDRLFGRSCILMLIDDGKALNEPVDERNIRKIHGLEVYDKRDISENYSQAFINNDPNDENFGQLEYYIITPPAGNSFIVHHSRMLLFDGEELPRRERIANNGAGLSCLDGVIKAIRRVETAHARAMDGVERSSTSMLKLNGLMDMVQSEQGTTIVQQRLDLIDLARQMLHTIAIDKEDEYQIYNMSLGGIAPLINEFEQIICGMTTIPMTILFGRSPGGMNATGYADFENYNNMVRRIQKVKVKPIMEILVKYIMLSKEGPFKGKELENWSIKFNDLQQQTDLEKEQLEKTKIDRHMAELNMINTLIQSQMLDPNDAKTYLIEQQELPITEGEIDLDDFNAQQNEENIEMDKQVKGQVPQPVETKNPLKAKDDTLAENTVEQKQDNVRFDGGEGSGNFGHQGVEGQVGGSAPSTYTQREVSNSKDFFTEIEQFCKENGKKPYITKEMTDQWKIVRIKRNSDDDIKTVIKKFESKREQQNFEYGNKLYQAEKSGNKEEEKLIRKEWQNANSILNNDIAKELGTEMDKGYYLRVNELKDLNCDIHIRQGFDSQNGCYMLRPLQSLSSYDDVEATSFGNGTENSIVKISKEEAQARMMYMSKKFDRDMTIGGISHRDESDIKTYTYMTPANTNLRKGEESSQANAVRGIINRTSNPPRTVYRGVTGDFAKQIANLNIGEEFTDKGFMSTSKNKEIAKTFAKDNGTKMKINIPSGFGLCMDISNYTDKDEEEVLINAGMTLRLKSKDDEFLEFDLVPKTETVNNDEGSIFFAHDLERKKKPKELVDVEEQENDETRNDDEKPLSNDVEWKTLPNGVHIPIKDGEATGSVAQKINIKNNVGSAKDMLNELKPVEWHELGGHIKGDKTTLFKNPIEQNRIASNVEHIFPNPKRGVKKTISINEITTHQPYVIKKTVDEYIDKFSNNDLDIDDNGIIVYKDDVTGSYMVYDGNHRLSALKMLGVNDVNVTVIDATVDREKHNNKSNEEIKQEYKEAYFGKENEPLTKQELCQIIGISSKEFDKRQKQYDEFVYDGKKTFAEKYRYM